MRRFAISTARAFAGEAAGDADGAGAALAAAAAASAGATTIGVPDTAARGVGASEGCG